MKKSLGLLTLILFSFALPVMATDYTWTGGGGDNNWSNYRNWNGGIWGLGEYPQQASDNAYVAGNYTINVNEDITVGTFRVAGNVTVNVDNNLTAAALNIQKAGNDLTSSWKTKFTGSKSVTFGSMEFDRAASDVPTASDAVIGTLEVDCAMTCSGTITTHSGTALVVNSGKTLSAATFNHSASNSTPKSQITVNGTLSVTGTLDLQNNSGGGCNALAVSSGGTVTAAALTWSQNDNYTNGGNAIDNDGTITLGGDLNCIGPVANAGTIESTGGGLTFKSGTTNSRTISTTTGDITFSAAAAGSGGTVKTTSGGIVVSAADDDSELGTVQTNSGSLTNSGSRAVSVTEFTMEGNASIANLAAGGGISVTKLSGAAHTASLSNANAAKSISVTGNDASAPTVAVSTNSENVNLVGGRFAALKVETGATATVTAATNVAGAADNDGTLKTSAALTVGGPITNTGTMATNAALTFASNFTNTGTFTPSASTVTATGTAATFTGNGSTVPKFVYNPSATTGSGLEITDGGNTFADFSCSKSNAKITASGANTFGTFTASGAGSNITLSGANTTFTNLSMTSSGGTLTVNAAQRITGRLTLKGENNNPLTVSGNGSGSLDLSSDQSYGNYLKVAHGGVSIGNGKYYSATNSAFASDPLYGIHNNWILTNKDMVFIWEGTTDKKWTTRSNWNYNMIPGTGHAIGSSAVAVNTRECSVTIPDSPSGNPNNFPEAEAGYTLGKLTVGDNINSPATLTLDTARITGEHAGDEQINCSGTFTNFGTIIYKQDGRVTKADKTTVINDTSNQGTVKFNGASGADDLAAVNYYNLIVSGDGAFSATTTFTVGNDMTYSGGGTLTLASATISNDFTISGAGAATANGTLGVTRDLTHSGSGALTTNAKTTVGNNLTQSDGTLTANAALTVSNALTVSGGNASFNNKPDADSATSANTAAFTTTGTVSLGNTAGDSFTTTSTTDALNLSGQPAADVLKLKLAGTITAIGGITLSHDATLNANTIFASPTTISGDRTLSGMFTVTNTAAAPLDTSAGVLILENANLVNTGAVTNGKIKFTGTSAQGFIPYNSSYIKITIDKSNGSVTVNNVDLETQDLAIKNKSVANFNQHVTVNNSYDDIGAEGNVTFKNGCEYKFTAPTATFNTTGIVTLNRTSATCFFKSGLVHTNGETKLYGSLATENADITLGATTLDAATTIKAGSGAVTIQGALETLNGTQALASTGSGAVTFGGTVGATNAPTKITAAGSATFNAATTVSGPVTIAGNGEFNGITNIAGDIAITGNAAINGETTTTNSGKITVGANAAINAATTSATTITVEGTTTVSGPSITSGGLQLYKGSLTFSAACAVTGTVQAAADIAANGAVTFANDVWLYSSAPAALGGAGGSLSITGNLFFAGGTKTTAVASNVTAKNILLLQGTVDVAAGTTLATSSGDIILLGAAYNINDTNEAAASQVADLFAYNHGSRKKAASYTAAFPTLCPDGTTTIPSSYTGTVNAAAGATIAAGQNFYANGLSILGSGAWTLSLPDNNLQTAAFAELYNSTITNCSASQKVAAAENNTVTACSNIQTKRPLIKEAYTVFDDAIRISFEDADGNTALIENSCNEISAAVSSVSNSAGAFVGTFTDADCQNSTDGAGDISYFFIKADPNHKWKTDATGVAKGSEKSSDRAGNTTCQTIPFLNLPKALADIYESLRDSSKNRIAHYYSATPAPDPAAPSSAPGKTYTAVTDKCAPVLTQVLTGQELRAEPGSQADCDSHNFVEFVYSEPVFISGGTTTVLDSDVNIHAAADLGATTNTSGGITFAGLAQTAGGKIDAALKSGSGSPHALYRNFSLVAGTAAQNQEARVRVSIAGWVDGSVDGTNKNWPGYISSAETPSGAITRIANANIKDKSPAQTSLDADASRPGHPLPTLTAQNAENELYGAWDTTPPSFALLRINGTTEWSRPATDGSQEYEFVGASYSTGTLSAIELHWFDNEPTYTENRQWFNRVGWADAASATEYSSIASYAADIRGGSRPDSAGANKTRGGIRYCSLYDANNSFKYAVDGTNDYYDFTQNIQAGANSSLFVYAGDDAGAVPHSTGAEDGLYCKLMLDQTSYTLQTTFILTFDSTSCFITDLAGNRIQCGKVTMKSIDRTPPAFTMSAVPLGTKDMLVIFSKALNTEELLLYTDATHTQTVPALDYIPKALQLTSASGTGIQIDQSVPARCLFKTKNATGILLALNQNAVLNDITSGVFVSAQSPGQTYDPLAGVTAAVTYIQDAIGNYVVADSKHAFSDFAVNAVQPQYAYDNSITDEGVPTGYSLYQEGSWAVRDWNAEQKNYGTLHAGKEVLLQAALYDGTSDKSGGLLPNGQLASGTMSAFFANKPDAASVSTKINENTGFSWRIWQPNYTNDIFGSLAPANNLACVSVDGTANDSGVLFDIPKEAAETWKSGDQISFVFKMGDYTVDHFANGTNYPLYAIRLKNLNDITSLDLWSFKVKETTLQRGGVTILNNVIDVNCGENAVVQVDMKESGNLNVIVMTLDGNIVKYLRHGYTDAGTHYYNWNGTNNGGSKVARGLYFVRVIGPGIDETRKVMCVK